MTKQMAQKEILVRARYLVEEILGDMDSYIHDGNVPFEDICKLIIKGVTDTCEREKKEWNDMSEE